MHGVQPKMSQRFSLLAYYSSYSDKRNAVVLSLLFSEPLFICGMSMTFLVLFQQDLQCGIATECCLYGKPNYLVRTHCGIAQITHRNTGEWGWHGANFLTHIYFFFVFRETTYIRTNNWSCSTSSINSTKIISIITFPFYSPQTIKPSSLSDTNKVEWFVRWSAKLAMRKSFGYLSSGLIIVLKQYGCVIKTRCPFALCAKKERAGCYLDCLSMKNNFHEIEHLGTVRTIRHSCQHIILLVGIQHLSCCIL